MVVALEMKQLERMERDLKNLKSEKYEKVLQFLFQFAETTFLLFQAKQLAFNTDGFVTTQNLHNYETILHEGSEDSQRFIHQTLDENYLRGLQLGRVGKIFQQQYSLHGREIITAKN